MKTILTAAVIFMTVLLPSISCANAYFAADYSIMKFDQERIEEAKLKTMIGRFGYVISDQSSVEFRIATDLENNEASVAGTPVRVRVKDLYGVYMNMTLMGSINRVYAVLGYTWADITLRGAGISESLNSDDWSYGAGIEHALGGGTVGTSFYLEYMRYYNRSSAQIDALSAGFKFSM